MQVTGNLHSRIAGIALVTFFLMSTSLSAQWTKIPQPGILRTSNGQPNLYAPVPRLPDGRPDLSGIWEPQDGGKYARDIAADLKPQDVPFQPWAKALFDSRVDGAHAREDPDTNCLAQGVPRINASPYPWKIIQAPGSLVIVYEVFNLWRQIFLDGRELLSDANPTWMGYSTGTWEGDTLVVDTRGFNGKAWLDQLGRPSTDALHVIERFRRQDVGHMDIQITIDDAKAYTKPWTVTEAVQLRLDTELLEFICNENNRDLEHLSGRSLK
jgi:hypothetical protein